MVEYKEPTRPRSISEDAKEERLAAVGDLVSYGLVAYKRSEAKIISVGAYKPITIPAVGEYFELQGDANIFGTVSAVTHSFGYVGGTAPSLNCTTYIVLVD
jgi:hypothetical protein